MKRVSLSFILLAFFLSAYSVVAQERPLPPFPATKFQWQDKETFADSFISDDVTIRIIKNNGVIIAVSGYDAKDHLVCEVSVVNQTDRRINVLPNDFYLTFRDKSGKFGYEFPLTAEKLAQKYQSRAKWGNFFRAFAAGMVSTTYETSEAGTINVTGSNGASASGIYSGTSRTTVPNAAATRTAAEANRRATGAANEKGAEVINASLRANTLFPNTYTSAMVYFERKKFQASVLYVMVDGVGYLFNFNGLKKCG